MTELFSIVIAAGIFVVAWNTRAFKPSPYIRLTSILRSGKHLLSLINDVIDVSKFATNARDAMTGGGTFTVTTEQVILDVDFVTAHGYGKPGAYALLTASDTGKRMDAETQKQIFDPFFTTKEVVKGRDSDWQSSTALSSSMTALLTSTASPIWGRPSASICRLLRRMPRQRPRCPRRKRLPMAPRPSFLPRMPT